MGGGCPLRNGVGACDAPPAARGAGCRGAVSTDGRLRKRFAGRSRRGARVCPGSRARENGASPCAKPTGHPAGARPAQWRPGPQAGSPARAGCRGAQLICSDSGRATRPRRTPRPPAPRSGHCASRAASHVLRVSRTRMHLILMTACEARGGPFSDHLSPFYRRGTAPKSTQLTHGHQGSDAEA